MTLAKGIKTEADAYVYMESLRWPDGPVCPHCASRAEHYFLTPKTATGARKTRTGSLSRRRVWKCRLSEAVLRHHRNRLPRHEGSAAHVDHGRLRNVPRTRTGSRPARSHASTASHRSTAWFMTNRFREAMKNRAPERLISGTVVADETFMGRSPQPARLRRIPGGQGQMRADKVQSSRWSTRRAAKFARASSRTSPARTCGGPGRERFHTRHRSCTRTRVGLRARLASLRRTPHGQPSAREYVRGDVSTNQAETSSRSSSGRSTAPTTTSAASTCIGISQSSTSAIRR